MSMQRIIKSKNDSLKSINAQLPRKDRMEILGQKTLQFTTEIFKNSIPHSFSSIQYFIYSLGGQQFINFIKGLWDKGL